MIIQTNQLSEDLCAGEKGQGVTLSEIGCGVTDHNFEPSAGFHTQQEGEEIFNTSHQRFVLNTKLFFSYLPVETLNFRGLKWMK